jgi:hypothetical protein
MFNFFKPSNQATENTNKVLIVNFKNDTIDKIDPKRNKASIELRITLTDKQFNDLAVEKESKNEKSYYHIPKLQELIIENLKPHTVKEAIERQHDDSPESKKAGEERAQYYKHIYNALHPDANSKQYSQLSWAGPFDAMDNHVSFPQSSKSHSNENALLIEVISDEGCEREPHVYCSSEISVRPSNCLIM